MNVPGEFNRRGGRKNTIRVLIPQGLALFVLRVEREIV